MLTSTLVSFLVVLLIAGVVLYLLNLVPIDATIKQIIRVLAILFVVLWVISVLTGYHLPGIAR